MPLVPSPTVKEAFGLAGIAILGIAVAGHLVRPELMARRYGWPASPNYQRQLAAFQLPQLYGLSLILRRDHEVTSASFLRMLACSSLLLATHHAQEMVSQRAVDHNAISMALVSATLGAVGFCVARLEERPTG